MLLWGKIFVDKVKYFEKYKSYVKQKSLNDLNVFIWMLKIAQSTQKFNIKTKDQVCSSSFSAFNFLSPLLFFRWRCRGAGRGPCRESSHSETGPPSEPGEAGWPDGPQSGPEDQPLSGPSGCGPGASAGSGRWSWKPMWYEPMFCFSGETRHSLKLIRRRWTSSDHFLSFIKIHPLVQDLFC